MSVAEGFDNDRGKFQGDRVLESDNSQCSLTDRDRSHLGARYMFVDPESDCGVIPVGLNPRSIVIGQKPLRIQARLMFRPEISPKSQYAPRYVFVEIPALDKFFEGIRLNLFHEAVEFC